MVLQHEIGEKRREKCRNAIKGAKGATNNAYFTAFFVLKYIIDLSACKLLYFLKGEAP